MNDRHASLVDLLTVLAYLDTKRMLLGSRWQFDVSGLV